MWGRRHPTKMQMESVGTERTTVRREHIDWDNKLGICIKHSIRDFSRKIDIIPDKQCKQAMANKPDWLIVFDGMMESQTAAIKGAIDNHGTRIDALEGSCARRLSKALKLFDLEEEPPKKCKDRL